MTRAIMNGCNGKMGQCITGICAQDPDIEIVAGIARLVCEKKV
jgi:4-hydroxy-tetrahydrodipicolinate reductase